jgi:hypothetical protein
MKIEMLEKLKKFDCLRETVLFNEENVGYLECGKKMSLELDGVFRNLIK